MDPILNPYSPGAGSPPPELVGRDPVLEQARILLGRVRLGRPEKSVLLTGLRGVGKTVLLNEIRRTAEGQGYRTVAIEALESKPLAELLIPYLKQLLFDLDRMAGAGAKVKKGLGVLRSFIGSIRVTVSDVTFGLDIDPEPGAADSGDLEIDLPKLFVAIAEAAKDKGTAVALFIDEVQYFSHKELGALVVSLHRIQQEQLPLVFVGAGLPILPGMAGEAKSYAERLLSFPDIGALSAADAAKALEAPAAAAGVTYERKAIDEIYRLTQGYPYFLQEWGYQAWNLAPASPISLEIVERATPVVLQRLDANFFRVRFDRLTPSEKSYLRAMAELGSGPYRTGEIAEVLGVKVTSLGPVRAKLIRKGMVYSPAHGEMAFTVPLFDEFMRRAMPDRVQRRGEQRGGKAK